jgi:iron-sulfur cluster assembly accessory protein
MFQVSEKAGEKIQEFLKNVEEVHPVRLMLTEGGCCGGPSLGMALDEPRDGDEQFHEKGITFLMTKDLFEQVKPVYVDFVETDCGSGFRVTSSLNSGDTGSCGGSCCC